jgi:acid stress chaperone HdeB
MHCRRAIAGITFVIASAILGAAAEGKSRDYGKLTCGDFLSSGKDNMAVIIWWLRGYHAGKSGNIAFDSTDPYAARLGSYCGSHRADNLIETSERILMELDRGI